MGGEWDEDDSGKSCVEDGVEDGKVGLGEG